MWHHQITSSRSVCVKQALNTYRWLVNALVTWHVSHKITALFEVIRQNTDGWCQQTFCFKSFTQQCFVLLLQVNFPANNVNFHWRWRWWDWIQVIFLNLFYFTYILLYCYLLCNEFFKRTCLIILLWDNILAKSLLWTRKKAYVSFMLYVIWKCTLPSITSV